MSGRHGGFLHRQLCLELAGISASLGAQVRAEHPVPLASGWGFVDLLLARGAQRVAVEVELRSTRVLRDIEKAEALGVQILLIVAPTVSAAFACQRKLLALEPRPMELEISVLTYGQAKQALRCLFSIDGQAVSPHPENEKQLPRNPC